MTKIVRPTAVGDKCRVIQSKKPVLLGDTLWEVTGINPANTFQCEIKEAGTNYRSQVFDLSLLSKVEA